MATTPGGVKLKGPEALAIVMADRGTSYRDLGHLTGYSAPHLCRIARGERRPSRAAALRIAKALQVPHDRIWGVDE